MTDVLLIHGSWQGAWCWRKIVSGLRARGHNPVAIDLPGHGEDRTPVESVTFEDYVSRTLEALDSFTGPSILVGNSMGGAIISQAAERAPDRIRMLVYVAGMIPPHACSITSFIEHFDPAYLSQILWAPDRLSTRISSDGVRSFAYPLCPPADIEASLPLLCADPVAPFQTPLSLTDEHFGRVPRAYVECLQDRILPLALQRAMRSAVPCDPVYSLEADHAPFFSAPEELVRILDELAHLTRK